MMVTQRIPKLLLSTDFYLSICILSTLFCLTLLFLFRVSFNKIRSSSSDNAKQTVIAFFHPHCSAGGGGERVLWKALQALGELHEKGIHIKVVIYTIDHDDPSINYKEVTLKHVEDRFSTQISPSLPIQFVHIKAKRNTGGKMSLIAQSIETIKLAWDALNQVNPHIYIDTTGCAFTFIVAKLAGCKIGAYVHYPTISTDMLKLVWERRPTYNNSSQITKSSFSSYLKLVYYTAFAIAYGIIGSLADHVMVNSSWTYGHIQFLWIFARKRIEIVYPPCDTKSLQSISLTNNGNNGNNGSMRENIVLSIGQFRPEKDHALQVRSFAKLLADHPDLKVKKVKLVLIGSCRGKDDEARVSELKELASTLGVSESVDFVLNQPYAVLKNLLAKASVGIHTMWNEHFGIGVVEMMAAGLIVVAHNSGGPKCDIVIPEVTGYLASTEEEYSDVMYRVLRDGPGCMANQNVRISARESAERFSDEVFNDAFKKAMIKSFLQ